MALSRPRFAVIAIVVSGSPLATVRLSTPAWDAGAIALAAGPLAACCCCRRCRCRRPRLCCSPAPLRGPQRPASPYPAAHASGCSHIRSACTLVPGPLLEGCEMDMALLLRMQCQTQGLPARAIRVSCMCASPGEAACGQLQCVWLPKRARPALRVVVPCPPALCSSRWLTCSSYCPAHSMPCPVAPVLPSSTAPATSLREAVTIPAYVAFAVAHATHCCTEAICVQHAHVLA